MQLLNWSNYIMTTPGKTWEARGLQADRPHRPQRAKEDNRFQEGHSWRVLRQAIQVWGADSALAYQSDKIPTLSNGHHVPDSIQVMMHCQFS